MLYSEPQTETAPESSSGQSSTSTASAPLKRKDYGGKVSKAVILRNVFDPRASENDPNFFPELQEDMEQECSKFGQVVSVSEDQSHPLICSIILGSLSLSDLALAFGLTPLWLRMCQVECFRDGSVAIQFSSLVASARCFKVMHGRWFDGRQIIAEYDEAQLEEPEDDEAKLEGFLALVS